MNRMSQWLMGLCLVCAHVAYASNGGSCGQQCPPKECVKPCPTPKPCPPKPCKPCPPVCFERGYPDNNCCLPTAYNEPANYELSPCPWNVWVDASFTYWMAYQEGMDLAHAQVTSTAVNTVNVPNSSFVFQDTKYKPGFKVGLGVDLGMDHWQGYAEYTWFRSTTSTSSGAAPAAIANTNNPVWVMSDWNMGQTGNNTSLFSSKWRVNMDLLDVALTRPYYQGNHLIVSPFGGLRATWIRQNLRQESTRTGSNAPTLPVTFHHKSNGWSLGPRAGFGGEWHLGWGFRFEGDVAGCIAFTQYTKVSGRADAIDSRVSPVPFLAEYSNYNTVRFNNDMNVAIGWGDYFDCRNYHLDILLSYDFQIFWNQNMMRQLVDDTVALTGHAPGNLYLQGLTVRAQFDF